jgi:hypothetical protein
VHSSGISPAWILCDLSNGRGREVAAQHDTVRKPRGVDSP